MTQEMLLQSFMQGFLHDLFVEKWHRFGRYHWFIYSVLVDGTEYFMLIIFALYLKYWLCSAFLLRFYAISALCLGWCGSALNDVRAIWLCYNNLRSASEGTFSEDAPTVGVDGTRTRVSVGGESNVNPVEKIAQFADYSASVLKSSSQVLKSSSQRQMDVFWDVLEWIRHHTIHIKWLGGITFSIACFRVLCANDALQAVEYARAHPGAHPLATPTNLARWGNLSFDQLAAIAYDADGTDPGQAGELMDFLGAHGYPLYEELAVPLAFGVFCYTFGPVVKAFLPFQNLAILVRSVLAMLYGDVSVWALLLVCSLGTFAVTMFFCYPVRVGRPTFGLAPAFDSPITSIQSAIELALLGVEIDLTLTDEDTHGIAGFLLATDTASSIDAVCFLVAYVFYTLFALVLLLNLLIAMMSNTCEPASHPNCAHDFVALRHASQSDPPPALPLTYLPGTRRRSRRACSNGASTLRGSCCAWSSSAPTSLSHPSPTSGAHGSCTRASARPRARISKSSCTSTRMLRALRWRVGAPSSTSRGGRALALCVWKLERDSEGGK